EHAAEEEDVQQEDRAEQDQRLERSRGRAGLVDVDDRGDAAGETGTQVVLRERVGGVATEVPERLLRVRVGGGGLELHADEREAAVRGAAAGLGRDDAPVRCVPTAQLLRDGLGGAEISGVELAAVARLDED